MATECSVRGKVDEIYLRLLKSNKASLRVMEKNGARCVGEDDEHLFMRIRK